LPYENIEGMQKLLELYKAIVKLHIINYLKNEQKKVASTEVKTLDYITKNVKFNSISGKNFANEFDLDLFV
jgi:hypothetical protein